MRQTILITGATDGIGLATANALVEAGHRVLAHGRSTGKLADLQTRLSALASGEPIETFQADLSRMSDVASLADAVFSKHKKLDVLINNAGVFRASENTSADGLDIRFAVNTIAPYLLTQRLMPALSGSRVINLSSAAQAPVEAGAMAAQTGLGDMAAYSQSKLALTMWSAHMGTTLKDNGPTVVAVNPGSLLGTKMVKDAFGGDGKDIKIGSDILVRAALSEAFASATGKYFDNDSGQFAAPHPDALDAVKCAALVSHVETILEKLA